MRTVRNIALDGSVVDIEGPDSLGSTATTYIFAATHEFESGQIRLGREIAREYGIESFDESYQLQGGILYRATNLIRDHKRNERLFSLAIWEGVSYSFNTEVRADVESSEVIALFNLFEIHESIQGISLSPTDARGEFGKEWTLAPAVVKRVGELGILVVRPRTPWTEAHLPGWEGKEVRHGRMYQDEPGPDGRRLLVHVNESAISTVWPERRAGATEQAAQRLSDLDVHWRAGEKQ